MPTTGKNVTFKFDIFTSLSSHDQTKLASSIPKDSPLSSSVFENINKNMGNVFRFFAITLAMAAPPI